MSDLNKTLKSPDKTQNLEKTTVLDRLNEEYFFHIY